MRIPRLTRRSLISVAAAGTAAALSDGLEAATTPRSDWSWQKNHRVIDGIFMTTGRALADWMPSLG